MKGRAPLELLGKKFGKLTVVKYVGIKNRFSTWLCDCDCGKLNHEVRGTHLTGGTIKACGCEGGVKTHGMKGTPLYKIWIHMRSRCYDENSFPYKDYGGRGIRLSPEWYADFMNFYNDMYETYKPGLTIERNDVNGNYEKSNCRWATRSEQARNRRCSRWIDTLQGRLTITEAANIVGISYIAMFQRIAQGWPMEKLLIPKDHTQRISGYKRHSKWASGELKWPNK